MSTYHANIKTNQPPFGMQIENRAYTSGDKGYRFGFQGEEKDDEISGNGNTISFTYRIHDTRLGRFLSVDPLFMAYPWNSPYSFALNKVIQFIELEGLEVFFSRLSPAIYLPRPALALPRLPALPTSPNPPLPIIPIELPTLPQSLTELPPTVTMPRPIAVPVSQSKPHTAEINEIDWHTPPAGPDELGGKWEEVTDSKNTSGNREFVNKETGERIRYDPARPGRGGHQENDHWHRQNPDWKKQDGGRGKYLDRDGNPVNDGSGPSHIESGLRTAIVTPTMEQKINLFNDRMKQHEKDLERYDKEMKKYNKEMKKYEKAKRKYDKAIEDCNCLS